MTSKERETSIVYVMFTLNVLDSLERPPVSVLNHTIMVSRKDGYRSVTRTRTVIRWSRRMGSRPSLLLRVLVRDVTVSTDSTGSTP